MFPRQGTEGDLGLIGVHQGLGCREMYIDKFGQLFRVCSIWSFSHVGLIAFGFLSFDLWLFRSCDNSVGETFTEDSVIVRGKISHGANRRKMEVQPPRNTDIISTCNFFFLPHITMEGKTLAFDLYSTLLSTESIVAELEKHFDNAKA